VPRVRITLAKASNSCIYMEFEEEEYNAKEEQEKKETVIWQLM
jgi:hypothetical protein